ncbi:MAG: D-glycerate dehydrogenase [Actinobacteria bacterium]|nr:MAG: D-glycerate dehydrogenase [Actinomycetota bacterium]
MKILASRRFPGPAWAELSDVEYLSGPLPDGAGGCRDNVDALAVVGEHVDDETLDLFPSLRIVANYGVGYDSIDVDACAARGVVLTNTPGVLTAATADLAFALLLALKRRVVVGDRAVREGRWRGGWADPDFLGRDVSGSTLGIVGFGRIGRAVAERAAAFEMRVLHHSRRHDGEGWCELDELLAAADAVSLHLPLTPETRGLLDSSRLSLLHDGACIINTARGQIVDEEALVRELVSGRIEAGLDVFALEPKVPRELLGLPNVVLTPHVGSATAETREAMTRVLVDNLLAVERGGQPLNPV